MFGSVAHNRDNEHADEYLAPAEMFRCLFNRTDEYFGHHAHDNSRADEYQH